MDNIDFASLPDAEAARLMAERDGFILSGPKCTWFNQRQYTTSLDAAVAWLGRMGLELAMLKQGKEYPWLARCKGQPINHTGPTAARALCNAGWAAVQAREAQG